VKLVYESIFSNSLRAFFVAFFAIIGTFIALCVVAIGFYALFSLAEEETFSSDVKILADAHGSRKDLGASVPVLLQINLSGEIGKDGVTPQKN